MIWYPYEQMKTMREPYKILDAEGVYLYTKDQKLIVRYRPGGACPWL